MNKIYSLSSNSKQIFQKLSIQRKQVYEKQYTQYIGGIEGQKPTVFSMTFILGYAAALEVIQIDETLKFELIKN
jgi:hypothetical protein